MIVACIALAIALGGVSYAATALPRNSVGTPQLKKNAVTSAKVLNGSLLAADFKAGQLPAGAKGDTGATGATGAPGAPGAPGVTGVTGVTAYEVVGGAVASGSAASHQSLAVCPGTKKAVGGGYSTAGVVAALSVTTATVLSDGKTFRTDGVYSGGGSWNLVSYVVCVNAT